MKIMTSCMVSAIALLAVANIHAAEAEKVNVSRVYTDNVAPADQQAYEAGIKNYNKCLSQHGFKFAWIAYGHETGNTYAYSYVSAPGAWADFDTMHTTGKVCDDTFRTEGNPHLKSETSAFLVEQADLSRMPKDKDAKPELINVTLFTLKSSREADEAFNDGLKKIKAAGEKSNWSGHYTVYKVRAGDKDSPDYILVSPYKNWADYGVGFNPPVWKMVEGVSGKADTDALRKALNDAIQDVSSHVDSYSAELTYIPSAK